MRSDRHEAAAEFRRILKWIVIVALLMVAGALTYLRLTNTLDVNTVVATTLGVFFSVLLGCLPPPSSATRAEWIRTYRMSPAANAIGFRKSLELTLAVVVILS